MVPRDFYTSLPEKGLIKFSGSEKEKYLQGQITADVSSLSSKKALLACHCDFKGKTWSVSYLFSWQDELLMLLHRSVLDKSLSELKKYGVFAKVNIIENSDNWHISAGLGKALEAEIINIFGHLPELNQETVQNENGVVMALQGNVVRYLILQPQDAALKLTVAQTASGECHWEVEDIKAGLADVRFATSNEFVPQMMNLQQLDAISFTKGCYMGQEVVARTKYLGKNKRAAFRLYAEGSHQTQAGDSLEIQLGENWRPAGKILRSATIKGQSWLLAVLNHDTEIGTVMRLKESPETVFTVLPQPYELA
jgi:folate-binding protein YgfZ